MKRKIALTYIILFVIIIAANFLYLNYTLLYIDDTYSKLFHHFYFVIDSKSTSTVEKYYLYEAIRNKCTEREKQTFYASIESRFGFLGSVDTASKTYLNNFYEYKTLTKIDYKQIDESKLTEEPLLKFVLDKIKSDCNLTGEIVELYRVTTNNSK